MAKYICLLILGFCLLVSSINAQDFKTDLQTAQGVYQKLESYHGTVNTKVFDSPTATRASLTKKASIRKKGNQFLYEIDGIMTLINDKYVITKDKKEKMLVCNKLDTRQKIEKFMTPDIDLILEAFDEVIFKGIIKGEKLYVGKSKDGVVTTTEIYLNVASNRFSKLVYHYNENYSLGMAKVEIKFKDISLNPSFSSRLFSEKQYVEIKGDKAKLKAAFSNYTLILGEGMNYM